MHGLSRASGRSNGKFGASNHKLGEHGPGHYITIHSYSRIGIYCYTVLCVIVLFH